MSSFIRYAIHPETKKKTPAFCFDDYFGSHKYGVRFDGEEKVYPMDEIEVLRGSVPKEKQNEMWGLDEEVLDKNLDQLLEDEPIKDDFVENAKKILERYEAGMVRAGVNANDVDYDILAKERNSRWSDFEDLLHRHKAYILKQRDREIVESPYLYLSPGVNDYEQGRNDVIEDILSLINKKV